MNQKTKQSAFHVIAKPTGSKCNLNCNYCFYLEKENLYPGEQEWAMTDSVLKSFIRQYIKAQEVPTITFAWQGGEPTLLGVDFFKRVVEYQREFSDGKRIENALQTNGILIDDQWGEFLSEEDFLVGLSLDGPEEFHDRYRVDKGGQPTFKRVIKAHDILVEHGVEFNILTCLQRHNGDYPLEIYRFLKESGTCFFQFIPIVERTASSPDADGMALFPADSKGESELTEWSILPQQYGDFLIAVFDEWVRNDVGSSFVQIFDIALEAWFGMNPSLCVFSETCGKALAVEHNGDLYSCDHFVFSTHQLGNLEEQALESMVNSVQQNQFGQNKKDRLPLICRNCEVLFVCHGDCPKHRFTRTPDGEEGLSYLCKAYLKFFRHIRPAMDFMAEELRQHRPPSNVMKWIRFNDLQQQGKSRPGRNDPCICGSGRKFKKCCGSNQ